MWVTKAPGNAQLDREPRGFTQGRHSRYPYYLVRKCPWKRPPSSCGLSSYIVTALLLSGCAASSSGLRQAKVAVLRPVAVGVPEAAMDGARASLEKAVRSSSAAAVVHSTHVDQASAQLPACQDRGPARKATCAVNCGKRLGASHVVVSAFGGLGKTHVVQLRVIRVEDSAVIRSVEETLFGGLPALAPQTERIASRLLDAPRSGPWYTRWWVWTAVAAATAAAVIVPVVIVTQSDGVEDVPLP